MRVYGLTGGIASGKTEAADRFRALGVPIIDADKIGHALIEPGGSAEAGVLEAFGPDILTDGHIDRRKLGHRVFADPAEMERLDAVVQPAIKEEVSRRLEVLSQEGHDMAVIDAALLGEEGNIADWIDGLILVLAPEPLRMQRIVEHRGLSPEQAHQRIASQTPPESKIPLADWVVENAGTLEDFRAAIDALAHELRAHGNRSEP